MAYMGKLNEADEEEAATVHRILSIFESMVEAAPAAAAPLAQKAGLLQWLLNRLKQRGFHANKLYASEVLSVLLTSNPSNQAHLGKVDGLLALLTAAS